MARSVMPGGVKPGGVKSDDVKPGGVKSDDVKSDDEIPRWRESGVEAPDVRTGCVQSCWETIEEHGFHRLRKNCLQYRQRARLPAVRRSA